MKTSFPFFSTQADAAGPGIYHSHPRCRVAQAIALSHRQAGTGEGRQECPFCYVLGQFQLNRDLREDPPRGGPASPDQSGAGGIAAPPCVAAPPAPYYGYHLG